MEQNNATPKLTIAEYLDALPVDMRRAVRGLIASKAMFQIVREVRPADAKLYEAVSFSIARAIAQDDEDYLNAMLNHALIITQINDEEINNG